MLPEETNVFSWFDYRSKGFDDQPKRGLRIDSVLVSQSLIPFIKDAGIDYDIRAMEKADMPQFGWSLIADNHTTLSLNCNISDQ